MGKDERDKIYLINKLICEKKLKGYHCIDLIEIEMHTQEPYLEYLVENKDLFDRARQRALEAFAQREEMAAPRTVRYGQKSASPAG